MYQQRVDRFGRRVEVERPERTALTTRREVDTVSLGEEAYLIAQFGPEIAEAKEQIEIYMQELDECDEIITDLLQQLYEKMSAQGQQRIMTHGFK